MGVYQRGERMSLTQEEKHIVHEALKLLMDEVARLNRTVAHPQIDSLPVEKLLERFRKELKIKKPGQRGGQLIPTVKRR